MQHNTPATKNDLRELEHELLYKLYVALAVQTVTIVGLTVPLVMLLNMSH